MGAVVMVLSLKHQLSKQGYYWFNLPKKARVSRSWRWWSTPISSRPNTSAATISSTWAITWKPGHEYFSLSEDELLERFIPAFKRINPDFEPDWIKKIWVFKTDYAQPVPLVNHSKNIPAIQTPLAGLYFASMSQVYPWDRGTNFAVEIGRKAARLMMGNR